MDMMRLYEAFKKSEGVSTDTRSIKPGQLFVALSGPNFNANRFAKQALEKGATAAVVDNAEFAAGEHYILVDDCLKALQGLANHHRNQLDCTVIAICGSNGKTTSKELTSAVLNSHFNTFFTPGNFNNHIGVPLSLLMLTAEHEYAIIEMGANHKGEHELLCQITEPDFGVITNNGKDHLEGFGSIEGVIEANKELYDYLLANGKTAFVNSDDKTLMANSVEISRILYGKDQSALCRAELLAPFPFTRAALTFENKTDIEINSQLFGSFQKDNIALAACIGYYFGVPVKKIKAALESYKPANMRTQKLEWRNAEVLLDAYNANPSSMMAVLNDFAQYEHHKKAMILGDMLEMGDASFQEHKAIVDFVTANEFEWAVFIGEEFMQHEQNGLCFFSDRDKALEWLSEKDVSDCSILIKGSRGLKLEKIVE